MFLSTEYVVRKFPEVEIEAAGLPSKYPYVIRSLGLLYQVHVKVLVIE